MHSFPRRLCNGVLSFVGKDYEQCCQSLQQTFYTVEKLSCSVGARPSRPNMGDLTGRPCARQAINFFHPSINWIPCAASCQRGGNTGAERHSCGSGVCRVPLLTLWIFLFHEISLRRHWIRQAAMRPRRRNIVGFEWYICCAWVRCIWFFSGRISLTCEMSTCGSGILRASRYLRRENFMGLEWCTCSWVWGLHFFQLFDISSRWNGHLKSRDRACCQVPSKCKCPLSWMLYLLLLSMLSVLL